MSFGFGVSDFVTVGTLTLQIYRSFKGAPAEFAEISRQLSSFHIVIHDIQDQAQDEASLLNRHGASRREELLTLCGNLTMTLKELEDLFKRYSHMGRNAWLRVRLGQEDLSRLREKLSLHIGLIDQFMNSLTVAAVGRMEPMMEQIYNLLRDSLRDNQGRARTVLSARELDTEETWQPLAFELQAEGIPAEYLEQNRTQIHAMIDAAAEDVGITGEDEIGFEDSASNVGQVNNDSCAVAERAPMQDYLGNIVSSSTNEEKEAAIIRLRNMGFLPKGIIWGPPMHPPQSPSAAQRQLLRSKRGRRKKAFDYEKIIALPPSHISAQALCWAISKGDVAAVRVALDLGADVNVPHNGSPPLLWVFGKGIAADKTLEIMKLLLDSGASVHGKEFRTSKTAVHRAAKMNNVACLQLLLEAGADSDCEAEDHNFQERVWGDNDFDETFSGSLIFQIYEGWRPLHEAVRSDSFGAVECLLRNGAEVNAVMRSVIPKGFFKADEVKSKTPLDLKFWNVLAVEMLQKVGGKRASDLGYST